MFRSVTEAVNQTVTAIAQASLPTYVRVISAGV